MKKRAFLIHGWEGYPEEGWFPWLSEELSKKGFKVEVLPMPNSQSPKIEEWVPFLAKNVGEIDEKTVLIGHSIGCQTIWRYLESLKEGERIAGAVLVAPWIRLKAENALQDEESKEIAKPWLEIPIAWEKVKKNCGKFVVILSDDDPYVYLEDGKFFKEQLGAKLIIEHNMKHFSGDDGINILPSAKEAVLSLASD